MYTESASPIPTDQPLEVRLARREEMRRWRILMERHHYLVSIHKPGFFDSGRAKNWGAQADIEA